MSGPLVAATNHCPVLPRQVCKNYRIPSLITLFGQQSELETDRHVHCNDHIIGKNEKGPAGLRSIAVTNRFFFSIEAVAMLVDRAYYQSVDQNQIFYAHASKGTTTNEP